MIDKKLISSRFQQIQERICIALETLDQGAKFSNEKWEREEGGGGLTRVLENGNIFEKGGVNFSAVEGKLPEKIKAALKVSEDDFFATGVSIVIHPKNPFHPIIHMNIRYFELGNGHYWFGGGIDLTPIFVDKEEASFFHHQMKNICNKHDSTYYKEFKTWADNYFFINHRHETRGIGGIFFDRLNGETKSKTKDELFNFVCGVGESFAPTYCQIIKNKGRSPKFDEQDKNWQYIRRGRYVEFNLVYDKGTKFGLDTDGRIESILMSLPPQANWVYDYPSKIRPIEQATLDQLKKAISWT